VKALAIILSVLLVLAHPAAAAAVLGAELAVCTALGWLVWRTLRRHPHPCWRTA
jgi:hypothetical protein